MKPVDKQLKARAAFTIVELLTVISIIVILIGLLVPALNMVKRYVKRVNQKNQFHAIKVGLETYNAEWDGYPPSNEEGNYGGAMKLAEALIGQDMLGFHPESRFVWPDPIYPDSLGDLSSRRSYVPADGSNVYALENVNDSGNMGSYNAEVPIICDMYPKGMHRQTGKLIGMPLLYFRADTTKTLHDASLSQQSIINYLDNMGMMALNVTWDPRIGQHPFDMDNFYDEQILNKDVPMRRPHNSDSFILMSAGFDGLYGTEDDVFNFGM